MKVKKTPNGNVKIVLTMAELTDLKTILNYSHVPKACGFLTQGEQDAVEAAERVALPLCTSIVRKVGVCGE